MPELLLTSSGGSAYAVRSDRVERLVDISSISRPMRVQRPDLIAVVVDERVLYFSDLAVRLGEGEALASRGAGLLVRDGDAVAGIAVGLTPRTVVVPDEDLIPVADGVGDALIDSCARIDGGLVPLLSDAFFDALSGEIPPQWSFDWGATHPDADVHTERLVEVRISGRRIALFGDDIAVAPPDVRETIPLPGAPPYLIGLASFGGAMHPVIELARLLDLGTTSSDAVTLVWTSGDRILLMIADALSGPLPDSVPIAELPPVLRRGTMRRAALAGDSVLPIVDPRDALGEAARSSATEADPTHRLDSDFPDRFLTAEVAVHEFALGGSVYALPESELSELDTSHEVMTAAAGGALVCGAMRVGDRIVPVLDLHEYLGFRIDDASTETGLLVQNGDFEAAFFPHRSLGTRTLDPSVQRPLPLTSARPFVYGCYVDGSDVRLILNVAMIAQFAQDPATQAALAELAPSAAESPAADAQPVEAGAGGAPTAHAADVASTADAAGGAAPASPEAPPHESLLPAGSLRESPSGDTATAGGAAPEPEPSAPSEAPPDESSLPASSSRESPSSPPSGDTATAGGAAPDPELLAPPEAPPDESSLPAGSSRELPPSPPSSDTATSASGSESAAAADSARRSRRPLAIILLLLLLATIVVAGIMFVPEMIDRAGSGAGERPEGAVARTSRQSQVEPSGTSETGAEESALPRRVSLHVTFDADSAELLPGARAALDRFIEQVSDRAVGQLTVVGHAARFGSEASSRALSEERARVTAAYLVRRLEIAPESVVVRGAGAREPIADNETEAGRSANRRAEVEIVFE